MCDAFIIIINFIVILSDGTAATDVTADIDFVLDDGGDDAMKAAMDAATDSNDTVAAGGGGEGDGDGDGVTWIARCIVPTVVTS